MRILYYNTQLGSFDGSNAHAVGLLDALREIHGEESVLVANHFDELSYSHRGDLLRRRLGKLLDPARMIRRYAIAARESADIVTRVRSMGFAPDIILARGSVYDYAPLRVSRELKCPLVLEYNTPFVYECCDLRNGSLRRSVKRFEAKMLSECDGIYCVSQVLADMLTDDYGVSKDMIVVIPNGYRLDLYDDSDAIKATVRSEVRERHSVSHKFVVTFVGSLQTWHGIPHLLNLAAACAGRSDLQYWVVGDGALRDSVKSYVATNANMSWFGNLSPQEVRDLLYASDLGIMPYDRLEHFYFSPLKMYEMLGAGLPFVATGIGQIAEYCESHLDGRFMFESPSTNDMSRAIDSIRDEPGELSGMQSLVRAGSKGCSWSDRAVDLTNWMDELVRANQ